MNEKLLKSVNPTWIKYSLRLVFGYTLFPDAYRLFLTVSGAADVRVAPEACGAGAHWAVVAGDAVGIYAAVVELAQPLTFIDAQDAAVVARALVVAGKGNGGYCATFS